MKYFEKWKVFVFEFHPSLEHAYPYIFEASSAILKPLHTKPKTLDMLINRCLPILMLCDAEQPVPSLSELLLVDIPLRP